MRIAILSDIHGNSVALDAVLADIAAAGGVDATWVLGDMVVMGPDPAGVLGRLHALPNTRFIHGNTDRYIMQGAPMDGAIKPAPLAPDDARGMLRMANAMSWTQGVIQAAGKFEWLRALALEMRVTLPDGTRFLGVHAAPGTDDGRGIGLFDDDDYIAGLVKDVDADLIMIGHTHMPLERRVAGKHVVNPGSVSMPPVPDLRAKYVLLHADAAGYRVEPRRADYDREAVIAHAERIQHPGRQIITEFLRGQRVRTA